LALLHKPLDTVAAISADPKSISYPDMHLLGNQHLLSQTPINKEIVRSSNTILIVRDPRTGEITSASPFIIAPPENTLHREKTGHGDRKRLQPFLKIKNSTKEFAPIAFAAFALEMVITLSFNSLEGLFLIGSTLAAGTFVYILDR
jgi:hypothetical protein